MKAAAKVPAGTYSRWRWERVLLDRRWLGRDLLVLFALAGWALALPHYASDFAVSMALACLMYVALASSWSLFCGTTRYLSLATAAFFGIGAYAGILGLEKLPWLDVKLPWLGAIGFGAAVAALVAVIMGSAVLHLRGTYFAVLTFGMTELIRHAVTYFERQVSGTVGRVILEAPERNVVYLTVLGIATLAVLVSIFVRRTRFGLALVGIGADEQRAQTLGVHTRRVKVAGFALTAAFAGAVGAAMSVRWTYIDPLTVFNPFIGFQTVLIALIGGAATLWGPLLAAVVFSLLAETLRLQVPQLYMMTLGLLLIVCVLYLPGGLASLRWDTLKRWATALRARWRDDVAPWWNYGARLRARELWRDYLEQRDKRRDKRERLQRTRATGRPAAGATPPGRPS
jgi:branched-chain amino acid transport system permease protein